MKTVLTFFLFFAVGVVPAQANESGLEWLLAQQQNDGRITAPSDETIAHHATFESLRTLHMLGYETDTAFQDALDYLDAAASTGLPFIARRLIAAADQGVATNELLTEIVSHQNADGGFSYRPGKRSSLLDTIEALEAFQKVGMKDAALIQSALDYVLQHQHVSGGFSLNPSSPPSIYLTSRTLLVLKDYLLTYKLSGPLQDGVEFLYQHNQANNWEHAWESAQALLALIPVTTDATRYADAVAVLRDLQNDEGSWSGSVYSTALSLRALHLAQHRDPPVEPSTGSITGRVQDGASGLPLAGVRVTVTGTDSETQSLASGGFELRGIPPGEHDLELSSTGYEPVLQGTHVEAGGYIDVGAILLQPLIDSGLLQGTVTDATSGAPVPEALVEVEGETRVFAATDADGAYQLELPVGDVEVTVTAENYEPAGASGSITAGAVLRFSPALRPIGTEPEDTVTLKGRVLDSVNETPVSGARVSAGPVETRTGEDGGFLLENITPAELTLEVQADGYMEVQLAIIADQGGLFDLGAMRLTPLETPDSSIVSGTVYAADSGEAIAGALLTIADQSVESDGAGRFIIEGVESLSFELVAYAPGYYTRNYAVKLAEHGAAELSVSMDRATVGEIDITGLSADSPVYPAYSQVRLNATLKNSGDSKQEVQLHLRVLDSQGALVEEYAVVSEATGGTGMFNIEPGTTEEAELTWYNRHYQPDSYRIWLQVHDADTSELLAERTTQVVVEETRWLEQVRLAADPHQVNQGASEELRILLSLRNRSNVPLSPGISYEWRDPDGVLLHSDTAVVDIAPATISTTLPLATMEWNFVRPGSYPFKITGIEGVEAANMEAGTVEAAPDIRIEPQQSVTPEAVLPQGDTRLRMRIRIEGVQAP